jgi:hypothetical protein
MGQLEDAQEHTLLAGGVNLIENPGSKTKDEAITADLLKKMIKTGRQERTPTGAALSPASDGIRNKLLTSAVTIRNG